MYVAVKGGEKAIEAAHKLQAERRRGDTNIAELSVEQISQQLSLAVERVMTEGGIFDRELAALAIKQASGDQIEAIFLLRAYRTTLPLLATCEPLDTNNMQVQRRVSATYKDLPGGQQLGPTYDYSHRLLDFSLLAEQQANSKAKPPAAGASIQGDNSQQAFSKVFSLLEQQGLAKPEVDEGEEPADITQQAISYPCSRAARLQQLSRGDEGFLLSLAYSTQRGYGRNHPFAGEIRSGEVAIEICPDELGFTIEIGCITLTECEMVNGFVSPEDEDSHFTRGYGLAFGFSERKAMAVALLDRSLQTEKYNEPVTSPAQDEEFVLAHADNVEAAGFVSHLKLPHYVDFQSELELLRKMRQPGANHDQL
ncbi:MULTISPECIES: carbon-phosphorus lyase complex subunit PhnI [unclassified Agarivorans]|uniref:carbon-phosphorus lyase complex subunit PhnI n=1 Tax=unclassified Agarivorans TaxID=2636026 RepID=UPI0026E1AF93|nr:MULTISPECIES: carbon-phosphorus lyase complex subunit PhnI [unclassified Agarivorans]MDO6688073.1 carbon-phosphorus lyase complex subunit PhnI [Agarivorans sp. 3_MG-2023]MDO6717668.1 carbon-phosphorus lyase complex subunit PhnI [Agarivorans sp. 2_MG-2023]